MERVTSTHQETGTESGVPLAADTEGKEQGGGKVSGAESVAGLQNGDALLASSNTHNVQHKQHEPAESAWQRVRELSSPTAASSPKMKIRALPSIDHSVGQGDSTVRPSLVPGMLLRPLNIRGDVDRDSQNSAPKTSTISFKTATTTVMSAGTMRNFRRSSAAMHVDLLRVFVPDMLINVSAMMYRRKIAFCQSAFMFRFELRPFSTVVFQFPSFLLSSSFHSGTESHEPPLALDAGTHPLHTVCSTSLHPAASCKTHSTWKTRPNHSSLRHSLSKQRACVRIFRASPRCRRSTARRARQGWTPWCRQALDTPCSGAARSRGL